MIVREVEWGHPDSVALRKAQRLSGIRLGVVAYSVSADTEMGDYDENPTILFKSGQLPPPFDE